MKLHDEDAELFDKILRVIDASEGNVRQRPRPPLRLSPETALALTFAMNPPSAPLFARQGKEWPS